MPSSKKRLLLPLSTGIIGALLLTMIYLVIVSIAESPEHALDLLWQDRWLVLPIILGFGVQVALYTILKKRLFVPVMNSGPSGAMLGASGTTSAVAMVACCAHHITDVLPLLGLAAMSAFFAEYRTLFMLIGLGTTLTGIAVMSFILFRERRKAFQLIASHA